MSKIAAVYTAYNEADIIEHSFAHMLSQGIDRIYVALKASNDGTDEILDRLASTGKVAVYQDTLPYHNQPYWSNLLAAQAAQDGHDWIIASDVDEFWYSNVTSYTIAERIESLTPGICKLYARSYQHIDVNTRQVDPKRLAKVAFRWQPDAVIANGNHDVSLPNGVYGVLDLRELQYRSFDHFRRKAADRNATLHPAARSVGDGWHHLRLEGMSDEQLEAEWRAMLAVPTVQDAIPTTIDLLSPSSSPFGEDLSLPTPA